MSLHANERTYQRVTVALHQHPYALGPFLGKLIISANMPVKLAGAFIGVHLPTLYRWIFGHSRISTKNLPQVAKLIAVLSWVMTERLPLKGTLLEREQEFARYLKEITTLQTN